MTATALNRAVGGALGLGMLAAGALVLDAGDAAAQVARLACGSQPYTIQSGDTLRTIAMRAYGRGDYNPIFDANRDVISNPSLLRVGQRIVIPCLGETPASPLARMNAPANLGGSSATDETARSSIVFQPAMVPAKPAGDTVKQVAPKVAAASGAATASDAAASDAVRLLAAADFGPITGASLPNGDLMTELLAEAMRRSGVAQAGGITFDDDRGTHLTQVLPQGDADIAYPWPRPDCARPALLDRETRWQCSDFVFSAPLYEIEIGFYFRADDETALAADPGLLFGRRLCRPEGAYDGDLAAEALIAPNVERVAPASARDCFAALAAGRVDAVSVSTEVAEAEIEAAGLGSRIVRAEMLGTPMTLHAVALETNENAVAAIQAIDAALGAMRLDGGWDEIVARHREIGRLAAR
ncbi:transporter substrate-binding domain-containing protein [Limibaculum sp. M0105]|uniref:Transporter substrate-binding domain-containing protein n=1 Tax=Thermohalobaculum xanthum TaxID=2753746 RepID=A0A8J7M6S9_9RHOB|nr:transporter substrate-binding domain-containing protein [Thermohalobaculum xanthum]MBK0398902.1 transporter substrate-binding domain-containing protein [Thermohalobaculum xanthum]